jgi:murein DD-endopeptidase MepM/ murein hydrolase activator NlpD
VKLGFWLVPGLLLAFVCAGAAQDMKPPRLSFATIDWPAALRSLADVDALGPAAMPVGLRPAQRRSVPPALARLNVVMSQHFAGVATSPVPVLMPFDVDALLNDQAAGNVAADGERYFSGFHAPNLFYPGPAGYDATFIVRTSDIAGLADTKFSDPIEVQISGSALLYDLDAPNVPDEPPSLNPPAADLEQAYPGLQRAVLEHGLRYTFVRYGVPYLVSIACFDTARPRYKLPTCRTADAIAQRFLRALRVVGGTPQNLRASKPLPIERPRRVSRTFGYYAPGQVLPGTDFRSRGGRADYTVYSQIRFPLADAPTYVNSELFRSRGLTRISSVDDSPNLSYAWRDNFCERRGFPVAQCPAGIGHQGQDIRPAPCQTVPGTDRCENRGEVVAVRGGMILRSPKQEAVYLIVNSANEHIRFRYLHMSPKKMDADNLLSGRRVYQGEVIGEVSNFSSREAGTSYHLHFDFQVPTKDGWVLVNPYMTLVSAYERLIGQRGTELADPNAISSADAGSGKVARPDPPEPSRARHSRVKRHKHYARQ